MEVRMFKGKAALGLVLVASVLTTANVVAADSAEAKPKAKSEHKTHKRSKHRIVKRFRTSNGYKCHTHFTRTRAHRSTDWSSQKRHGKSFTHCVKIKPKRAKAHRSGGSNAWVLPRYVVMCESGGNPRVVNRTSAGAANGYPAGLYQITGPTWAAYGGRAFAPTADQASVYGQGVIAKRVLANQGSRAWACW